MKKTAAVAAAAVMLGVGGCASIPTHPAVPDTSDQTSYRAERLIEHVQEQWIGDNVPSGHWIETTALLTCKRAGGGETFTIAADNKIDAMNYELVIVSASKLMCNGAMSR